MKNIRLINGPNINLLGIREPQIYGNTTYDDLILEIQKYAKKKGVNIDCFQSNSEGELVTEIQNCYRRYDGIIINPAAYTHTSVAILDALKAVAIPTVEVHISKIDQREPFRQFSYVSFVAEKVIQGEGLNGYFLAMDYLINKNGFSRK